MVKAQKKKYNVTTRSGRILAEGFRTKNAAEKWRKQWIAFIKKANVLKHSPALKKDYLGSKVKISRRIW